MKQGTAAVDINTVTPHLAKGQKEEEINTVFEEEAGIQSQSDENILE